MTLGNRAHMSVYVYLSSHLISLFSLSSLAGALNGRQRGGRERRVEALRAAKLEPVLVPHTNTGIPGLQPVPD